MTAGIVAHVRYYELRLAEGQRRPELHRHQLAALPAILERARHAADPADLERRLRADGLGDALAVAQIVDGYANRARLHDALGAELRARAVRRVADAAGDAIAIPLRALDAAVLDAELADARAAGAAGAVTRWVQQLHAAWTTTDAGERMVGRLLVDFAWQQIADGDPAIDVARLASYPPYRARVPLDDGGLAELARWRDAITAEPVAFALPKVAAPPAPTVPAAPRAEAPAPADDPVPALVAALEADRPLADARATARRDADTLATRAGELAQPHLAALAAALDRDLAAATTAAEAWLAGELFRERLDATADALAIVVAFALRPLELALDDAATPAAIAAALLAAEAALGAPWREIVGAGAIRVLVARGLAVGADPDAPITAALPGEVGVSLAATFRRAIASPRSPAARALAAAPTPATPAAIDALLRDLDATAGPRTPRAGRIRIAGADVAMSELGAALCRPRPSLDAVLAAATT